MEFDHVHDIYRKGMLSTDITIYSCTFTQLRIVVNARVTNYTRSQ